MQQKQLTDQEIQQILTNALVELFEVDAQEITPETNLYTDLDIDSIDAIDLIDFIKRKTGYKLNAEDFRTVRTVQDVIEAVKKVSINPEQEVSAPQDDSKQG
ncbi:acyl carrier protein [Psittacicella hinzii]|uniref:Acyl carrier protein n=1 Tax=Psittacicella hinzii TaxID=2028575 RepID=A0A3A1YRC1_9GAMM|nr:acyl carrier protein [Psittacicella hinzii]RIY39718.1 acyl carrier protein [Psittacicella hinzii]